MMSPRFPTTGATRADAAIISPDTLFRRKDPKPPICEASDGSPSDNDSKAAVDIVRQKGLCKHDGKGCKCLARAGGFKGAEIGVCGTFTGTCEKVADLAERIRTECKYSTEGTLRVGGRIPANLDGGGEIRLYLSPGFLQDSDLKC